MGRQAISRAEHTHIRPNVGRLSRPTFAPAFVDNQPGAVALHKLSAALHDSPRLAAQRKLAEAMHNGPHIAAQRKQIEGMNARPAQRLGLPEEEELLQGQFAPLQRMGAEEEDLLQGKFEPVQRQDGPEEEELLQGKFAPVQRAEPESDREPRANDTGLPDKLKSGIESFSGMSLDNVKVHYNSAQPAQLNAQAYAQGSDIHVAPGQEQHLPCSRRRAEYH